MLMFLFGAALITALASIVVYLDKRSQKKERRVL